MTAGSTTTGGGASSSSTTGAPMGGSSSSSSTTGAPAGGATIASIDFEDGQMHGWNSVDFNNQPTTQNGSGIVANQAHSGTKSFLAAGGSNVTDAVFLRNKAVFPAMPNKVYVRFYIRMSAALPNDHTTFAIVDGNATEGSNSQSEVRMGGQFNYLVANLESNDAERRSGGNDGDPTNKPNAVKLPINTWTCMEILYDGVGQAMHTWVNDAEIVPLAVTQPSDWSTTPSSPNWMPNIAELKLGWESYGGGVSNNVWLDDVVISHDKVGCAAP